MKKNNLLDHHQDKIVSIAREWLDTPFYPQGRKKYHGCDCWGLIVSIAYSLFEQKIIRSNGKIFDIQDYNYRTDSHLMRQQLDNYFDKVASLKTGAIILFALSKTISHVAIISYHHYEKTTIIHSCNINNKVCEKSLCKDWQNKIVGLWSYR